MVWYGVVCVRAVAVGWGWLSLKLQRGGGASDDGADAQVIEVANIADISLAPSLRLGQLGPKSWAVLYQTGLTW